MKTNLTNFIKKEAKKLGFDNCGIAKVEPLIEDSVILKKWLSDGFNGKMQYLENYFEKRTDPSLLLKNAKSVISLLFSYYPTQQQSVEDNFIISKYAYSKDYHSVLKEKLFELIKIIRKTQAEINIKALVDSAPVFEKSLAQKAGLGWIGKNTLLITKKGSFFFLAELFTDMELEYDETFQNNYCNDCTKCIDACPTNALDKPYSINASKCISYLTISLKDDIPQQFHSKLKDRIFGCDICQDVCPWNKKAISHNEEKFIPRGEILSFTKEDWRNLEKDDFKRLFKNTAIERIGFEKLKKNIEAADYDADI